mmetsp:Transcript_134211/g.189641  ORF Transcript_134211/g.189641 Transcript_134211/m.189641 type:complete len:304 (-) Transcript_134211:35-946(-)
MEKADRSLAEGGGGGGFLEHDELDVVGGVGGGGVSPGSVSNDGVELAVLENEGILGFVELGGRALSLGVVGDSAGAAASDGREHTISTELVGTGSKGDVSGNTLELERGLVKAIVRGDRLDVAVATIGVDGRTVADGGSGDGGGGNVRLLEDAISDHGLGRRVVIVESTDGRKSVGKVEGRSVAIIGGKGRKNIHRLGPDNGGLLEKSGREVLKTNAISICESGSENVLKGMRVEDARISSGGGATRAGGDGRVSKVLLAGRQVVRRKSCNWGNCINETHHRGGICLTGDESESSHCKKDTHG